jgi:hypothetical protein
VCARASRRLSRRIVRRRGAKDKPCPGLSSGRRSRAGSGGFSRPTFALRALQLSNLASGLRGRGRQCDRRQPSIAHTVQIHELLANSNREGLGQEAPATTAGPHTLYTDHSTRSERAVSGHRRSQGALLSLFVHDRSGVSPARGPAAPPRWRRTPAHAPREEQLREVIFDAGNLRRLARRRRTRRYAPPLLP